MPNIILEDTTVLKMLIRFNSLVRDYVYTQIRYTCALSFSLFLHLTLSHT